MIAKKRLKVGIIRFPGSNCDFDVLHFFKKFGHKAEFIWYKDISIPLVGGNVSLYNAHGTHSIKPTPVLIMAGVRPRKRIYAETN